MAAMLARAMTVLAFIIGAPAASAQNPGEDAAKFELTEYEQFGAYELFCGHFGNAAQQRCELRRTLFISPQPKLRAMVIFWRFDRDGLRITVDAERTTKWVGGGIAIDGERLGRFDRCARGRCVVEGEEAKQI